jgi:hypothetical protein
MKPQENEIMDTEQAALPAYLRPVEPDGHLYGTLSYNSRSRCWVIKAEPCVTELAKRLFPGSAGHGRGEARFTAHRRVVGELYWLMLRYPLAVKPQDEKRWQDALDDARSYALRREAARLLPESAKPPETDFVGSLLPFQERGLAFLLRSDRALLADEMGLGKTVQALAWLASTQTFPVLIVPPAHLIRNWEAEIGRFLGSKGKCPGST